jgi:hypothetical protein
MAIVAGAAGQETRPRDEHHPSKPAKLVRYARRVLFALPSAI